MRKRVIYISPLFIVLRVDMCPGFTCIISLATLSVLVVVSSQRHIEHFRIQDRTGKANETMAILSDGMERRVAGTGTCVAGLSSREMMCRVIAKQHSCKQESLPCSVPLWNAGHEHLFHRFWLLSERASGFLRMRHRTRHRSFRSTGS
jgi:hypothetical protein